MSCAAAIAPPAFMAVDVVDDPRLLVLRGARNKLPRSGARLTGILSKIGARFHTKRSKRRRPRWSISSSGFTVNAADEQVKLEGSNRLEGTSACARISALQPGPPFPARAVLQPAPFLNFL